MEPLYAKVVLPLPIEAQFTYSVPEGLMPEVRTGCRVLVSFQNRWVTGYVVDLGPEQRAEEPKEVLDVLDPEPVFSDEMLRLTKWVAEYYLCSWGEALKAALPAGIGLESKHSVRLMGPVTDELLKGLKATAPRQAEIVQKLREKGVLSVRRLAREVGERGLHSGLRRLEEKGWVEVHQEVRRPRVGVKYERVVKVKGSVTEVRDKAEGLIRRAPRQAECLRILLDKGMEVSVRELSRSGIGSRVIRRLEEDGLIELSRRESIRDPYGGVPFELDEPPVLTPEQRRALEVITRALRQGRYQTVLLRGVTGSGKTEVYIRAMAEALDLGRRAIVLVPEIALTSQAVGRFRAHFGKRVTVLHSRLSLGERYDAWRKIREGEHDIVVGARSAVFAPVKGLGLMVVDEEHETTYKQYDVVPRYHARDVAIMRAKFCGAVAVLGTATPGLESCQNARKGKFVLCELPYRIEDLSLPKVQVVDMRQERKANNWGIFSRLLKQKIEEKLSKGEQIILLQNRRGFSPFVQCRDCGFVLRCPSCNVTLTYHTDGFSMCCHYCNHREKAPSLCPKCHGHEIRFRGVGTQRVEEELGDLFPGVRVFRMDADATTRKGSHQRILEGFQRGEVDVLLGTQMVAKGLDFSRVTLVGVVSADVGLNLPDFRASERTFQLLTQVAGRAGRGRLGGEVIIQTYSPDNYGIRCAQNHDFLAFFTREVEERKELRYPPFSRLLNILFRGKDEAEVELAAQRFAEKLRQSRKVDAFLQILGPAPAPLTRIRGEYRWQIIIKGEKANQMQRLVRACLESLRIDRASRRVKINLDMDPVEML